MAGPLTLVILAAGMGSRFGGPKQIAAVGPSGETLLEYGLYDARRVGFGRFVFVIRKEIEQDFREGVLQRFIGALGCHVVFQEKDDFPEKLPAGVLEGREKPWGTGHALWAARGVTGDAAVGIMNADDFYGRTSFELLAQLLRSGREAAGVVSYRLDQTLSDEGGVSRGVCTLNGDGHLAGIHECKQIQRDAAGDITGAGDRDGRPMTLTADTPVSMNLMGFTQQVWALLEKELTDFARQQTVGAKSEYGLPDILSRWMTVSPVKVTQTPDSWIGLTHASDLEGARQAISLRVEAGQYPAVLWR